MEAKYIQAIKAGIIGGVILAVCMLVRLFIDIINTNNYSYASDVSAGLMGLGLISCCVFLVEIIVILGTGALAVKMAAALTAKIEDALVIGGVAGAVAGLIGTVIQVVGAVIKPGLSSASYTDLYNYYPYSSGIGNSVFSMFTGVVGAACCCGPVLIIIGAVIAAIGGAIYAVVVLKIK